MNAARGAALAFGSGLAAYEQRETFHGFPLLPPFPQYPVIAYSTLAPES